MSLPQHVRSSSFEAVVGSADHAWTSDQLPPTHDSRLPTVNTKATPD